MNFGVIKGEARLLLGNRSIEQISDSRMGLWTNNSQIEILGALQFFENEKRLMTPMVVGQEIYSLPTDCLAIYDLRDNTTGRKIRRSHYRKFDNLPSMSGVPTHYIRFGRRIQLNTTPSSANVMYLRYCVTPTPMVLDVDNPSLSVIWHEAIMFGTIYRGWYALGEMQRYLAAKNEFLAIVRSRQDEAAMEESDEDFGIELLK
jgi:hypothetical protein